MKVLEKQNELENIVLQALVEDLGPLGDITTDEIIDKLHNSTFHLIAGEDAILAGSEVFEITLNLLDKNVNVSFNFNNGDEIKKGSTVAVIKGSTNHILRAERVALNYICHLSGIATYTRKLVNLIKETNSILLDTRKTTPGLRVMEKNAIIAGGARNHRLNLSEMILIKDNHIKASSSITLVVNKLKKKYGGKFKIEIEVENFDHLKEAINCKPDIIMFDNWSCEDLKKGLSLVPPNIKTEASGGITEDNIQAYAKTGVDYISTSLPVKNSRWVDFSLELSQ